MSKLLDTLAEVVLGRDGRTRREEPKTPAEVRVMEIRAKLKELNDLLSQAHAEGIRYSISADWTRKGNDADQVVINSLRHVTSLD